MQTWKWSRKHSR